MKSFLFLIVLLLTPIGVFGVSHAGLSLQGSFTQGGLLLGKTSPANQVLFRDRQLQVSRQGLFVLGFGRDAETRQTLTVIEPDGKISIEEIVLSRRDYDIQRIDGISKRMMNPTEEDLLRISQEAERVAEVRQQDSDRPSFQERFSWPVIGRISGIYGSQRILNGEPRRPHFGIDIAAPKGTPVNAPAGGVVTLVHQGMFFSGATLIVDHGHGLTSSFLHLEKILVEEGESVVQGQMIATVGASGRVTGPHLDWRVNWFDQRLDPALLVPDMPVN